jgi:hypothetical protein
MPWGVRPEPKVFSEFFVAEGVTFSMGGGRAEC